MIIGGHKIRHAVAGEVVRSGKPVCAKPERVVGSLEGLDHLFRATGEREDNSSLIRVIEIRHSDQKIRNAIHVQIAGGGNTKAKVN